MAKKIKEVEHALPSLALVFGYIAIKELQRPIDRIEVLSRLGYGYKDIAKICNLTDGTVAVALSNIKKAKKKGVQNAKQRRGR